MKKLLAILVALGIILATSSGAVLADSNPDDYDDLPLTGFIEQG